NTQGTMEVTLLTSDPYDTDPVFNLVSGQRIQSLTLRQARPEGNTLDNVYVLFEYTHGLILYQKF
ncbi:MAG: hypothetical protein ACK4F9_04980, partial [Brevinematia bacterium]